jgi:hypothetical protein
VQAALLTAAGEPVLRTTAELRDTTRVSGTLGMRVARIEVPLEGVAPGSYLLRAVVRAKGETVTELSREVVVRPGPPPPEPARPVAPEPAAFDPTLILGGDVAQRLVASLRGGTLDVSLRKPAELAAARSWDALAAALPASPDGSVPGAVLRGMAFFAQRQYVDAAAGFQAAFELDKSSGATAFLLGWAHAASGDDIAAISAWRAATVATPALVPPYLALADAYMRQGQPPLALQVVQAGLSVSPKSVELQSRLAELQR